MFNRFFSTNFFPKARTVDNNNNGKSSSCRSNATMSLYDNDGIVDGEIQDNGSSRCHKIIRPNYGINKRIGLKKLSYSDHARFLTEQIIESYKNPMVNELIENECVSNIFDFYHGFIETNDRNNESSEYPKSVVHEFLDNSNAKSIGNQLEGSNMSGITRNCGLLYAAKRTSERNNRRRQKRALQKGMHTANCKTSSTTDLCKNKSSLKYLDNN